jgi:phenylalanyl-tRNA synthetase alpha chain
MLRGQFKSSTGITNAQKSKKRQTTVASRVNNNKKVQKVQKRQRSGGNYTPQPGQEDFSTNITPSIQEKIGVNLHQRRDHPICTIKNIIFNHFDQNFKNEDGSPMFKKYDNFHPEVSTTANFDDLLVPQDHVSRSIADTFYRSPELVLRPHTSAHQTQLLRQGDDAFLVAGDCFRRDEIDASHYPVFHQMEGLRVFKKKQLPEDEAEQVKFVADELKRTLEGVARTLFGEDTPMRWIDAYFPFTDPSFELEVEFNGKWLECLGCGMTQRKIMSISGREDEKAWAFGLGLDRLAMVLFEVPDIRLFWSQDERFSNQFKDGEITKFKPFSKYPGTFRDVSFWYDPAQFVDNDFFAVTREGAGDCVDNVELMDAFVHPKSGRHSKMFRVHYRSLERTLTTEEVNDWQDTLRKTISGLPTVELR